MEQPINVIDHLASSLNRRDEAPNLELAEAIVKAKDKTAVAALVKNLSNKKAIQNDCIKVLYEIGARDPQLIVDYVHEFVGYLSSKNNRLQWGAMTALSSLVNVRSETIYNELTAILLAADDGSVITKDQAVNILIGLCAFEAFQENSFALLMEQLLKSPTNQIPMYAERALPIVNHERKAVMIETLTSRLNDIEKESKRKRVEKVIKKYWRPIKF